MEVGAFMGVDGIASIMPLVNLANIFSGQKHFIGEVNEGHNWPREEN